MSSTVQEALLRVARAAIEMVLQQIAQQIQVLVEQVHAPMQQMVDLASDGDTWTGTGSERFIEYITGISIPGADRIQESCNLTTTSITNSLDIVDTADNQVNGIVQNLESIFQAVY